MADKIERVLSLYTRLMNGGIVYKEQSAKELDVSTRGIARDIEDIRAFLEDTEFDDGSRNTIVYDRSINGYKLKGIYKQKLTNPEVLAISKILLDSRAFTKKEMEVMLEKLLECCVPEENQKVVQNLIKNEEFHYIEPRHKTVFIENMWLIGQAINENKFIEFQYQGVQGHTSKIRKVKPLAIMFSDYYFYLAAIIEDESIQEKIQDTNPTIYRIDRIQNLKVLEERFRTPYANRFEEGEYRKRIQFMRGGKLRRVHFEYRGYAVESVLDRLPTAEIEEEHFDEELVRDVYKIKAEVFGDGIDMWLRCQGDNIKIYK